jgi:hypothetical protein
MPFRNGPIKVVVTASTSRRNTHGRGVNNIFSHHNATYNYIASDSVLSKMEKIGTAGRESSLRFS